MTGGGGLGCEVDSLLVFMKLRLAVPYTLRVERCVRWCDAKGVFGRVSTPLIACGSVMVDGENVCACS